MPDAPARVPAAPAAAAAPIPLSYPQRWMWVTSKLAGSVCNLPLALRFTGPLHVGAVEAALQDVITQHQVLRTIFYETRGVPYQRILDGDAVSQVLTVDATTESEIRDEIAFAARRTFDLTREIPFWCQLYEIAPAAHVLLMNIHHIAVDQWSLGLLTRDFSLAYAARQAGGRHEFPALPLQYADYCVWQSRMFGDDADPQGVPARQMAFWEKTLANMPTQIRLPASRTRRGAASYNAGAVPIRLDAGAHARLMALGRATRASLFMIVHTAVAAVLTHLGAGDDLPLCTPIAGRDNVLLENVVGLFLNTLILRTDTSGDPTFRELLTRVRGVDLDAYEHQDVPFESIMRSFARNRGSGGRSMIQVCLIVNDGAAPGFTLPETSVRREPIGDRFVMFDLLFELHARRTRDGLAGGLDGVLAYSTDLFEPADVEPVATGVQRLLSAAVEQPDVPVSRLLRRT